MQRRLEDVSHFFFDHRERNSGRQAPMRPRQPGESRPRIIHFVSFGDELATAVLVACLATSASRLGRRVLVAETHEQPFGIAFAFALPARGSGSVLVEVSPGLWVSSAPLLGARQPGVLCDPPASADWRGRANQSDLVFVHVNYRDGSLRTPGMPVPDEFLIVAGDGAPDGPPHAYRAIKRAVLTNPSIELGLIVVGEQHELPGRPGNTLVRAVATFLGRPCPVLGSVPSGSIFSQALVAGAVLGDGGNDIARAVGRIAGRWMPSDADVRPRTNPTSGPSGHAAPARHGGGDWHLRGRSG